MLMPQPLPGLPEGAEVHLSGDLPEGSRLPGSAWHEAPL